ncbi:MAG: hypothetical protein JWO03_3271 [Bacteroidetes bacterium]|nr:hypothetical protein [Bacteroidota bacterium]
MLIISYFFPPANFAGSYRIGSWAKHLHKFGYYPIIVTRAWNMNQTETTDVLDNNIFQHEKHDTHEVYRLPYHSNLRDRLHAKYGDSKLLLFRKFLTLVELVLQNFTNAVIPYHNLYDFSKQLLGKEKDIKVLLVSGRPFQLFKFGDMLHRSTGIKWIADYRDEWNTHQWILDESISKRTIRSIESRSEKKWVKSSALLTTCSENWVKNISAFVGRSGKVVLNGYEDYLTELPQTSGNNQVFTIVHNGTTYSSQPIEIFLSGYKKFIDENAGVKIKLLFPGVGATPVEGERIRNFMKGYEKYVSTSPRIPKSELVDIMASAHLFLMIGTQGVKGHHSSKIFEYLAMKKPIILCPDDKDVMSELMRETKGGFTANTAEEVTNILSKMYAGFGAGKAIDYSPDLEKITFYSREKQAQILAQILDEVESFPAK